MGAGVRKPRTHGIVASLAVRGLSEHLVPEPRRVVVWGGLHFVSVGFAIGRASAVAHLVRNTFAWPIGGFLATAIYLLGSASQLAFTHLTRRDGRGGEGSPEPRAGVAGTGIDESVAPV